VRFCAHPRSWQKKKTAPSRPRLFDAQQRRSLLVPHPLPQDEDDGGNGGHAARRRRAVARSALGKAGVDDSLQVHPTARSGEKRAGVRATRRALEREAAPCACVRAARPPLHTHALQMAVDGSWTAHKHADVLVSMYGICYTERWMGQGESPPVSLCHSLAAAAGAAALQTHHTHSHMRALACRPAGDPWCCKCPGCCFTAVMDKLHNGFCAGCADVVAALDGL
jgi:hypothetical protein